MIGAYSVPTGPRLQGHNFLGFGFFFFFFSLSGCVIYSLHSVISQDTGGHQYLRRITLNADH